MTNIATTPAITPPPIAANPAPIVARDFPGWLPPMLVKELRQGLRTRGFVGTLVGFQIVMLVLMLIALSTQNVATTSVRMAGVAFTGFFWMVLAVQLLFVTPSRALGGLQLEVDARTIDLLMLTRLTAWRVVLGKWISLLAQAALLLVAMLPYLVVRYFTDNADIVSDLGQCLGMLAASAVLTAAGLWGSGVAKLIRVILTIALGLVLVNFIGVLGVLLGGRVGFTRSGVAAATGTLDVVNAILITAFFLVSAVRNIAPPAENHSLFARVLPLIALLAAPLAHALRADDAAGRQLYFAAAFAGFVLMFELAAGRPLMPTHWRGWYHRGGLGRIFGRLAIPGWPSAMLYGIVVTGLWLLGAFLVLSGTTPASHELARHAAWLSVLAFAGLLFPAVVQSFVRTRAIPRVLLYFFGLGLPALLAGLALWLAESRWKFTALKTVMEAMPFSSFLFALNKTDPTSTALTAQGMMVGGVLLLAAWQARHYWRQLDAFEFRDHQAAAAGNTPS